MAREKKPSLMQDAAGLAKGMGTTLRNFVRKIAGCKGDWTMRAFKQEAIEKSRAQVGQGRVICGLSGGVDSSAVVASMKKAATGPVKTFSIGFADVGSLHIIEAGELVLRIEGTRHVEHVRRGDVVLLPRGDPHHLSDAGHRGHAIARDGAARNSAAGNSAAEPARWLCGTFTIGDPQASHLLASLPAVIILRGARGPALEGLDDTGTRAPGQVKPRNGIAVTDSAIAAALRPADNREKTHALCMKPGALLARSESDIGLSQTARPVIFRPVEAGADGERVAHVALERGDLPRLAAELELMERECAAEFVSGFIAESPLKGTSPLASSDSMSGSKAIQ